MVTEQVGDEVRVGEIRAKSVGLLSVVSGWDVSDGSVSSDGDEVTVSEAGKFEGEGASLVATENASDPIERAWERNPGPEVEVMVSEADGSKGEGVISDCAGSVRDPVEVV